jgi:hypothetical protein
MKGKTGLQESSLLERKYATKGWCSKVLSNPPAAA